MEANVRKHLLFAAIAAVGIFAVAAGSSVLADDDSNGKNHFKAELDGFQETPASISTTGSGTLDLRIDEEEERIEYELSYSDIEGGAATASHIHFSGLHQSGGVVAFLCGGPTTPPCPPTSGTVTGVIVPADVIGPTGQGIEPGSFAEFVRAIRAGFTYANVHSPRWPGGEIRGQIDGDDDDDDEEEEDE
jgi:hypothetical protein